MKIALISSWLPRECGIATFSRDLSASLNSYLKKNRDSIQVFAMEETGANRKYGKGVVFKIRENRIEDYAQAAQMINSSGFDLVLLEHEFGIFGKDFGENILTLLEKLRVPIITSFHTVILKPRDWRDEYRISIMRRISELSQVSVVTTQKALDGLAKLYKLPTEKFALIHHGTPKIPLLSEKEKNILKKKLNLENRQAIITFGMIRTSKGIQFGIRAMKKLSEKFPKIIYLVVGIAHPRDRHNVEYYQFLKKEAARLKLKNNVLFVNQYLKDEKIFEYIQASDIMLLPYLAKEQVSSGVLAWGVASGKAVVSTPFQYAKELLADKRGFFVDYENPQSIEKVIIKIFQNPKLLRFTSEKAYAFGQKTNWKIVGKKYYRILKEIAKK